MGVALWGGEFLLNGPSLSLSQGLRSVREIQHSFQKRTKFPIHPDQQAQAAAHQPSVSGSGTGVTGVAVPPGRLGARL